MDSYIGQVRLTACNSIGSADWLPCDGRLLQIRSNQPLYALITTTYGGDGVSTFALPDLRSRAVIGTGVSRSSSLPAATFIEGQQGGENPPKSVSVDPYPPSGPAPASITLTDLPLRNTNVLAGTKISVNDIGAGPLISSNPDVAMVDGNTVTALAPGTAILLSASLTGGANVTVTLPPISVLPAIAQSVAPPSLGLAYVICVNGIFPSRD